MVRVKGSERKTRTDAEGIFKIQAVPGETLVFTYPGRSTVEAMVNGGTSYLTIAMPVGVQVLDEVLLNKRIRATAVKGIV